MEKENRLDSLLENDLGNDLDNNEATAQTDPAGKKTRKSRIKREKPTIASLNEKIDEVEKEIVAIQEAANFKIEKKQAEKKKLLEIRAGICLELSEELGLLELLVDPEKARWLKEKMDEYGQK